MSTPQIAIKTKPITHTRFIWVLQLTLLPLTLTKQLYNSSSLMVQPPFFPPKMSLNESQTQASHNVQVYEA
jgi:hypothetical protein